MSAFRRTNHMLSLLMLALLATMTLVAQAQEQADQSEFRRASREFSKAVHDFRQCRDANAEAAVAGLSRDPAFLRYSVLDIEEGIRVRGEAWEAERVVAAALLRMRLASQTRTSISVTFTPNWPGISFICFHWCVRLRIWGA